MAAMAWLRQQSSKLKLSLWGRDRSLALLFMVETSFVFMEASWDIIMKLDSNQADKSSGLAFFIF